MNRIDIRGKKILKKIKRNKKINQGKVKTYSGRRESEKGNMTKCNNSYNKSDGLRSYFLNKAF